MAQQISWRRACQAVRASHAAGSSTCAVIVVSLTATAHAGLQAHSEGAGGNGARAEGGSGIAMDPIVALEKRGKRLGAIAATVKVCRLKHRAWT